MPVRNPNPRNRPRTPDQEPTTARGRRRRENTPEYQANLAERQSQSYGHRVRGKGGGGRRPFKGPSKRPPNISNSNWRDYMSGFRATLN